MVAPGSQPATIINATSRTDILWFIVAFAWHLALKDSRPAGDEPATEAIYEIGTLASVLQLLKLPDGTVKVLVEGALA